MYPHPAVIIYFYPRPLRGGRRAKAAIEDADEIFLSTPSARRATHELDHGQRAQVISIHALCEEGDVDRADVRRGCCYFYPRPLRGGRLGVVVVGGIVDNISIHALCEEGDPENVVISKMPEISIHALCEEGDPKTAKINANSNDFYPRPLRGGRQ